MAGAMLLLIQLFTVATPAEIHIIPEADSIAIVMKREMVPAVAGAFFGTVSLNGSPAEVPVSGTARPARRGTEISMTMRDRDLPEDWARRLRVTDFDYRLRGRVANGAPFEWSGTERWDQVTFEKDGGRTPTLISLKSIEMTELSLLSSEGSADVAVRNPLSFALKIARTRYRLMANGREVGWGSTPGILLRPGQTTDLALPIDFDHGQLLAAAGSAIGSGGQIDGRLIGELVVRLPGGDISVPLDLSGRFSAAP